LGHFDNEGFTYIEGRMKRDAKIFGVRVSLDEVEDLLRVYGPTAVVSAKEKLLIFCEYGDAEEFGRIRQELATKLMLHHSAFHLVRLEQIPRTASGKIDYPQLVSKT
jgi:acyl-coenzyme A synthetase/AMP-(fatty) acid ligase